MSTLNPESNDEYYSVILTRPTPIPPPNLDFAVMEVGHLRLPAGTIFPETMPTFCTLVWCVEGFLSLVGRGWRITADAGNCALLESDQYVTTETDTGCEVYYLLMDGPRMNEIIPNCHLWAGYFPFQLLPIQWLEYIGQRIHDLSLQSLLVNVGLSLFQDVERQAERGARDRLVWQACRYMRTNWHDPATNVESVLKHLGVSRSSLSPRFKAEKEVTLARYLSDIRLYQATKMLANETLSIKQIALRCGFVDATHFSKWFKKQCGKTPRTMKYKK